MAQTLCFVPLLGSHIMEKMIYSFFDFSTVYPSALLMCVVFGSYWLWFAIWKIGNAEVTYKEAPILVKNLPFIGRFVAQGFYFLLGGVLVLFGLVNLFQIGKFYLAYYMCDVAEIEGQVQILAVERTDGRDRELYSIIFTVDNMVFDTSNAYSPEEKAYFIEGSHFRVQYGYIGKHLMIYKIFVLTPTPASPIRTAQCHPFPDRVIIPEDPGIGAHFQTFRRNDKLC